MTGYSLQFSNISAKSNDFFSRFFLNKFIFQNFVIDFVLKEIKNVKNIIIWPLFMDILSKDLYLLTIQKKIIFAYF